MADPMAVVTITLPIEGEVMAVSITMTIREEEGLTVVVAEVPVVGVVTTLGVVVEAEEVGEITTSTGHWMTTAIPMRLTMTIKAATAVEVQQEGATRWIIDLRVVFGFSKAETPKSVAPPTDGQHCCIFFRFFSVLGFGLHRDLAHGAFDVLSAVHDHNTALSYLILNNSLIHWPCMHNLRMKFSVIIILS
jgi:hypothetical protein